MLALFDSLEIKTKSLHIYQIIAACSMGFMLYFRAEHIFYDYYY